MATQSILKKFQHWIQTKLKNVKIVEIYMGIQKTTSKTVLVLVIDSHAPIEEQIYEDEGKVFDIVCRLWKFPSPEGAIVSRLDYDKNIPEIMLRNMEGCLMDVSRTLFENHSNLEVVSVSAHRSQRNGDKLTLEPCIVLYCSCKGVIPVGEKEFPTEINMVKTDVREGFFYLFPNDGFFKRATDKLDPLRIGASIGRKGMFNTGDRSNIYLSGYMNLL
jgi:hypothetical protein